MTDRLGFAIAYSVLVAAPMFVGVAARHVQGNGHFARRLFALGALFALTAPVRALLLRRAAVGGRLEVDSQPGRGARVVGTVPLR